MIKHLAGENRDPKVVWHAPTKRWICALYLDGDRFALFTSPDLKEWTKLQELSIPRHERMSRLLPAPGRW